MEKQLIITENVSENNSEKDLKESEFTELEKIANKCSILVTKIENDERDLYKIIDSNGNGSIVEKVYDDIEEVRKYYILPLIDNHILQMDSKIAYIDSDIEFNKAIDDKKYARALKNFFSIERIERKEMEDEEFETQALYLGYLENNTGYLKYKFERDEIYEKIRNIERERVEKGYDIIENEQTALMVIEEEQVGIFNWIKEKINFIKLKLFRKKDELNTNYEN